MRCAGFITSAFPEGYAGNGAFTSYSSSDLQIIVVFFISAGILQKYVIDNIECRYYNYDINIDTRYFAGAVGVSFLNRLGVNFMKQKLKRVPCCFGYWECDSFAEYLREMSLKGWHFIRWSAGLVFEKGQPEDVVYSVEVFGKGSEMDTRPEPDTEEFAEYCQAAGWKLIDSKRKFCIFRREREDAVPIETEEERFQNIWKAQKSSWLNNVYNKVFCGSAIILAYFFWIPLQNWIFEDVLVACILIYLLRILLCAGESVLLFLWKRKKIKLLRDGEAVTYEKKKWNWLADNAFNYIILVILLVLAWHDGFKEAVVIVGGVLGIVLLFTLISSVVRPSREDHLRLQITGGFLLVILVFVILLSGIFAGDFFENDTLAAVPLVQADYKQMDGEITDQNTEQVSGVFGSLLSCAVDYDEDHLSYKVYESDSDWILERIWQQTGEDFGVYKDCTENWKAVRAVKLDMEGTYLVRYPHKLLLLYCGEALGEEQIQVIVDKLGLMQ